MIAGGIEMPNEKRHTVEYLLTAMLAIFILYCMVYISNTIDMPEYKRCLKEQGMAENEIDIINIYNITMKRAENEEKIAFTKSTLKYVGYGLVIDVVLFAMLNVELSKKYAQERMYGDAEWGKVKQFKRISEKKKKFYFTDHSPWKYLLHIKVYLCSFKKVWKEMKNGK